MYINGRCIRLFISSTFADFEEERDILHQEVFPHLAKLCNANGFTFQAVDLRWGISQNSAEEQRTLQICLREVRRSIETSPRPNFLILLGDRYGWQPLPDQIPRGEFEAIVAWLRASTESREQHCWALESLTAWYKLDHNSVPTAYFLQPRHGISDASWFETEDSIRRALRAAANGLKFSSKHKRKYFLSATALEIEEAIFGGTIQQQHDVRDHVFCFHRQRRESPPCKQIVPHQRYDDTAANRIDEEAQRLRLAFLSRLRAALAANYLGYPAFMADSRLNNHHLFAFAADARLLLEAVVRQQLESAALSPLAQEKAIHHAFMAERAGQFVGRRKELRKIIRISCSRAARCLVLHGLGGSGKTSLIAALADQLVTSKFRACIRFLGLSASTSSGIGLLRSLSSELAEFAHAAVRTRVRGYYGWRDEFRRLVHIAAAASPDLLFVVVDALDQLPSDDPACTLDWIPEALPENVRLIVSSTPGVVLDRLRKHLPAESFFSVGNLAFPDGKALLQQLLHRQGRVLQDSQIEEVMKGVSRDPSPLYIRLASELVRDWRSVEGSDPDLHELPASTESLILHVLRSLAKPSHHGPSLVNATMSLLAAARHGLTEPELIELLSGDARVMADIRRATPKGGNLTRIPFIYWSRLRDELAPYLAERNADGLGTIGFFHRLFSETVQKRYLRSASRRIAAHSAIAEFFSRQADFLDENHQRPNRRRLAELGYQLMHAGQYEALHELLSRHSYFDAKIIAGLRYELLKEYRECFEFFWNTNQRRFARKCAQALASHLIRSTLRDAARIDLEDVHAALGFYRDAQCYAELLHAGIRLCSQVRPGAAGTALTNLLLGMQARQANIWRRNGQLGRAKRRLLDILPQVQQFSSPSELARVEYDLGYISYLQGNFRSSIPLIERSARSSRSDGNLVGESISNCVAEHQRWLLEVASGNGKRASQRFARSLTMALKVFERNKHSNSTSSRWVMNVHAHRFSLAYRAGHIGEARSVASELRQDPWLATYADDATFQRLDARIALLEGDCEHASNLFGRYIEMRQQQSPREESLAEDFLDLGFAYLWQGRNDKALSVWREGTKLPADAGNRYWQAIIRQHSELVE